MPAILLGPRIARAFTLIPTIIYFDPVSVPVDHTLHLHLVNQFGTGPMIFRRVPDADHSRARAPPSSAPPSPSTRARDPTSRSRSGASRRPAGATYVPVVATILVAPAGGGALPADWSGRVASSVEIIDDKTGLQTAILGSRHIVIRRTGRRSPRSACSATDRAVTSPRVLLWLAATIVAGAVIMSLEMVAVRLFAPYFGYSIYVWGTTICVVMGAMVAGYAVGGRLADTPRAEALLFTAILSSAAWQLLALWTMRLLLPRLAERSEVTGVTLAALVLFAPSMVALAATGPILVRLCAEVGTIGRAAGLIYALSTAGSMAGILATIFLLLPRLGTHATLQVLCGTSFLIGAVGLRRACRGARRGLALAAAAAALLGWRARARLGGGIRLDGGVAPTTSCASCRAAGSGSCSSTIPRRSRPSATPAPSGPGTTTTPSRSVRCWSPPGARSSWGWAPAAASGR